MKYKNLLPSFIVLVIFALAQATVYPCSSQIYCHGLLLEAVQKSQIFPDDKTFVDMNLRNDPDKVVEDFMQLYDTWPTIENTTSKNVSNSDLLAFLAQNFAGPGVELEPVTPSDWKSNPLFIGKIADPALQEFASDVNAIWSTLAMQVSANVSANPDRYSFIPVPNPIVIPGGRFREFYYWDSYWILKGLLLCEMFTTARGMIENLGTMVDTYGFVPNGGRIYYTHRSQPPMLTLMVSDYFEATGDSEFLEEMLPRLESEHNFFMTNRSVEVTNHLTGKTYTLNQFRAPTTYPRPESFIEDCDAAEGLNEVDSETLFQNIASAAESGADFSTRWFKNPDDYSAGTRDLDTMDIVEVDLNAIMCKVEKTLSEFYKHIGDSLNAEKYGEYAKTRAMAFEELFWNNVGGIWQDWSISGNTHRKNFYATYITPWWADCHGLTENSISPDVETMVMTNLKEAGVFSYPGGVPTSLVKSGQQWDLPNVWAPLQFFMIDALSTGHWEPTQQAALNLASTWIETTYLAYRNPKYGIFFEKYDAFEVGVPGGGGEYTEQTGFGWTNGMILYILNKYGSQLSTKAFVADGDYDSGDASASMENAWTIWMVIGFCCFMVVVCCAVQCYFNRKRRNAILTPQRTDGYGTYV